MGRTGQTNQGPHLLVFGKSSADLLTLPSEGTVTLSRDEAGRVRLGDGPGQDELVRMTIRPDGVTIAPVDRAAWPLRLNGTGVGGPQPMTPADVAEVGDLCFSIQRRSGSPSARTVLGPDGIRGRLEEEAERARRYGGPLSVLALRVEETGGRLPAQIGAAVATALRRVDVVGWIDAQEICVLLPHTGAAALDVPARRVVEALAQEVGPARAGAASFPEDGVDGTSLLVGARMAARRADVGDVLRVAGEQQSVALANTAVVVLDPQMKRLFRLVERLAPSDMPVLVRGETGVGKEVVAQAVHQWSRRADAPFVCINCAAMTDSLLESELFGHQKGAFTGADTDKVGLLESADGGTVFLDEVSEASPRAQAELLRVLETKRVRPVGGIEERPVDIRVVAATNRDLEHAVESGTFRKDLLYRLGAATLAIPPLRDRPLDIPALARCFVERAAADHRLEPRELSAAATQRLLLHDWPGNVRELRNAIEYAMAVCRESTIEGDHLPEQVGERTAPWLGVGGRAGGEPAAEQVDGDAAVPPSSSQPRAAPRRFRRVADEIRELERIRMAQALEASGGVRKKAAALIGMPLRTFVTKLKVYQLADHAPRRGAA